MKKHFGWRLAACVVVVLLAPLFPFSPFVIGLALSVLTGFVAQSVVWDELHTSRAGARITWPFAGRSWQ